MRLLNVALDLTNVECNFTQPIKLGEAGELSYLPAELLAVNISSLITQQDGHHQDDLKEETGASGVGASFAASLMTEVHPSLQMAMQQSTGFFPNPVGSKMRSVNNFQKHA